MYRNMHALLMHAKGQEVTAMSYIKLTSYIIWMKVSIRTYLQAYPVYLIATYIASNSYVHVIAS